MQSDQWTNEMLSGILYCTHLMTIEVLVNVFLASTMVHRVGSQTTTGEELTTSSLDSTLKYGFGPLEELLNNTASPIVSADQMDLKKLLIAYYNLDPNIDWRLPLYFSTPYQLIGTLFQGIIFIVGVLGNAMVVIVVLRSRSMRTPTNCYLVSLAIADSIVLVASIPNEIVGYFVLGDKWIWGRAGCAIFIFLQYLGINVSSLSIAAFTIERYIAICHPMLAHKLCTVSRAQKIIIAVWLFASLYCLPWLFLTKLSRIHYISVEAEVYRCDFKLKRSNYYFIYMTDLVLFYILPLLMSCVLYGLIARVLYNKDIMRRDKLNTTSSHMTTATTSLNSATGELNTTSLSTTAANNTSRLNLDQLKKNASSSDASRVQVIKMLAVVVAVFATLWLPYRALVVYNSFASPPFMELWYLMFAKTMIYVNSAINPIIYSACSMKFRREFKLMLTCTTRANYYYRSHRTAAGGNGMLTDTSTRKASITTPVNMVRPRGVSLQYNSSHSINNLDEGGGSGGGGGGGANNNNNDSFLSPMHALVGYGASKNKTRTMLTTSASVPRLDRFMKAKDSSENIALGLTRPVHAKEIPVATSTSITSAGCSTFQATHSLTVTYTNHTPSAIKTETLNAQDDNDDDDDDDDDDSPQENI